MAEHCVFLRAGNLSAIVGDDTKRGPGGPEYSGLWSLVHDSCPAGTFQAAYAGLIASAHRGTGPTLEPIGEQAARLVRSPCERNPHATVRGTYRFVEPHYVDYTYEVEFARDDPALPRCLQHTWCSYMNSPAEPVDPLHRGQPLGESEARGARRGSDGISHRPGSRVSL